RRCPAAGPGWSGRRSAPGSSPTATLAASRRDRRPSRRAYSSRLAAGGWERSTARRHRLFECEKWAATQERQSLVELPTTRGGMTKGKEDRDGDQRCGDVWGGVLLAGRG